MRLMRTRPAAPFPPLRTGIAMDNSTRQAQVTAHFSRQAKIGLPRQ
jgi:hypothetical protein